MTREYQDLQRAEPSWAVLPFDEPREAFVTIPFPPGARGEGISEVLAGILARGIPGPSGGVNPRDGETGLAPVQEPAVLELRVFASRDLFPAIRSSLDQLSGAGDWPLSLLDGSPGPEGGIAGLQLHLLQNTETESVVLEDRVVGKSFERHGYRYCILGGIGPEDRSLKPGDQARETLLRMEEVLATQGMELRNLVRTWFFLDDILGWYGDFNEARTRIFQDREIFRGYIPASTGIGAVNHLGSAITASALAVRPASEGLVVRALPSPLQCPAGDYGSSFSRAAELVEGNRRRILVSGTASIDPDGRTAHTGDVEGQIDLTFQVVEAILAHQGVGFGDVLRGNAYFQDVNQASRLAPALERYGLSSGRLVVSQNTVCREDLLFEMEVEAAATS